VIIIFSGTDGAGKSTQIDLLIHELLNNGYKVKCIWARGGYTPIFMYVKRVARIIFGKKIMPSGRVNARNKLIANRSVSKAWLIISIFDLLGLYAIYVRALSSFGYVVVCDRYIGDSYIDFKRNFGSKFNDKGLSWRLLDWAAPKPDHAFLLHVPVETSIERSRLKNEPFPDSKETLEFRLSYYLNESLFPSSCYYKVECIQPVENIQALLRKQLGSVL